MKKFTSFDKLSKKEQKKINSKKRLKWAISPVTRKSRDEKAYDRNKFKKFDDK